MSALAALLSGAGAVLDVPGSMVRDALGGRNPFDQVVDPFSWDSRLTGRDLLRLYGLAGEEDSGLNAAGGMATEMLLDPLMWTGAGALTKALRGGAKAAAATRSVAPMGRAVQQSVRPVTALSVASPVAGAYIIGDNMNDPEGQQSWKNWAGAALMAAPLAMGASRGARRLSDILKKGKQQVLPSMEAPAAATPAAERAAVTGTAAPQALSDLLHKTETAPKVPGQIEDAIVSSLKQGLTNPDIAAELNRQGITTPRFGKPWNKESVREWLRRNMTPEQQQSLRGSAPKPLAERLAEPLPGSQQQTLSDIETPAPARSVDAPVARPAPATPPPGMVTQDAALTEHYDRIYRYYQGWFHNRGFKPELREELAADALARVWDSLQRRPDLQFIPPGEAGWDAIKILVKNRGKDAIRAHLGAGKKTGGSRVSREDAYKLNRNEERLGSDLPDYNDRVGRMGTVADKAPTPVQQAQLNELPGVYDLIEKLSKNEPKKVDYFKAMLEDPYMTDKLTSARGEYKHPIWVDMADKLGVESRTVYNWTQELIQRAESQGLDPGLWKGILPALLAMLGLGGATGSALARRVANIPQVPEPPSLAVPAAGPFEFATIDGQVISPPWV